MIPIKQPAEYILRAPNCYILELKTEKPPLGQIYLEGLVVFTLLFRTGRKPFVRSSLEYAIVAEGVNNFCINITATAVSKSVVCPPDLWRRNASPKNEVTVIRTLILVMAKAPSWMSDFHRACGGSAWTEIIVAPPNDRLVVIVHFLIEVVAQHYR